MPGLSRTVRCSLPPSPSYYKVAGRRLHCPLRASQQGDTSRLCKVYVAAWPMVGTEAFDDLLKVFGRKFPEALALHRVVLLQQPDQRVRVRMDRTAGKSTFDSTCSPFGRRCARPCCCTSLLEASEDLTGCALPGLQSL